MRLGWVERKHLPVDPRLRPGWLRQKRPYQSPAEFTTLPQKPALEAVTGGKVLNTAGSGRAAGELRARAPRAEPALGQWEPEVGGECGAAAGPIRLQARPGGGDGRRGRGRWRQNYINRRFSPWNAREALASPARLQLRAGGEPRAVFSTSSHRSQQVRGGR